MKKVLMLLILGFMAFGLVTTVFAAEPDPAGTKTGGAADVVGASANAPTADDLKNLSANEPLAAKLADVVGHNRIAINIVWTLVCGFLVMFMQAGFALAETGFTQGKERRSHHGHELHGICCGYARLLDMWFCTPDGRGRWCGYAWRSYRS